MPSHSSRYLFGGATPPDDGRGCFLDVANSKPKLRVIRLVIELSQI